MLALITALGLIVSSLLAPSHRVSPPIAQVGQIPDGARLLGTTVAGPDTTGLTETLVAYFVPDPSLPTLSVGRVVAVAIRADASGIQTYPLGDSLGETPFAELTARDLNGDGLTELAVLGGVGAHSTVLSIFRWNGSGYSLLEEFFGDSGIGLTDLDGDGIDEVVIGMRHYDRAQLRHDTVMRWIGSAYVADYSRWSFTFDPSLADYPESSVLQYYLHIADHRYRAAYDLLGGGMQSSQSFADFERGFAGTRDVRVEDLEVTREDDAEATVRVSISSVEVDGSVSHFEGTWLVQRINNAWRLTGSYIVPL
jgi:hypothetical protein